MISPIFNLSGICQRIKYGGVAELALSLSLSSIWLMHIRIAFLTMACTTQRSRKHFYCTRETVMLSCCANPRTHLMPDTHTHTHTHTHTLTHTQTHTHTHTHTQRSGCKNYAKSGDVTWSLFPPCRTVSLCTYFIILHDGRVDHNMLYIRNETENSWLYRGLGVIAP